MLPTRIFALLTLAFAAATLPASLSAEGSGAGDADTADEPRQESAEESSDEPKAQESSDEPKVQESSDEPKAQESTDEPKVQESSDEPKAQESTDEPKAETSKKQQKGPLDDLGSLERQAVEQALAERDLEVVRAPEGMKIGEVLVATQPVFSKRDGKFLRWFNRFHWTSNPEVIRRDILLKPGDTWKADKARETERNLRNPTFLNLVVVLPVESDKPDEIDLLVVTRDIWSLRTNSDFEIQNGVLSELAFSLSENNVLGQHKVASAQFEMDLGDFGVGPLYYDPHLFGTHAEFQSSAAAIFNRQDGTFEGTRSSTVLAYPLWNLERRWGADLEVTHTDQVIRRFQGIDLLPYDNPDTPAVEDVGQEYRFRTFSTQLRGLYAFGDKIEHRFGLGYRLELQNPEFTSDFPDGDGIREAFRRDVMAPRERNSAIFASYEFFTPKWITYRNITSFDLPEEEPVGPYAALEAAPTLEAFGSLRDFVEFSATAGWLIDLWHDGYIWTEASSSARLFRGEWSDQSYSALLFLATPDAFQIARLVARTQVNTYVEDTQNRIWFVGGQTGLRGYGIGEFTGESRWLTNVEIRSMPLKLAFLRFGGVLFYDLGDAGSQLDRLNLKQDIGIGFRLLVPQSNTVPARIDWALPIGDGGLTLPGRVSIGFGQAF